MKIVIDLQSIIDLCANSRHVLGAHKLLLKQIEPPFIEALLHYTHGNQSQAAHIAGINRKTLSVKMRHYRLGIQKQVGIL